MLSFAFIQSLYELLIGSEGDPLWEDIFRFVGTASVIILLLICIIFYVVINRWRVGFHRVGNWFLTLTITMIITDLLAMFHAQSVLEASSLSTYIIVFGLVNAVFTAIAFFLFSLLFKNFSIHAKYIPF